MISMQDLYDTGMDADEIEDAMQSEYESQREEQGKEEDEPGF